MIALAKADHTFCLITSVLLLLLDPTAKLFLNLRCPLTELHCGVHTGRKLRGFSVSISALCVCCMLGQPYKS